MAAIERGEGADDAVVRGWLAKALTVSRGPQWVCSNCHHIHGAWQPVCDNCKSFDTLSWTIPPSAEVTMPSQTQMLPLLVGTPEAQNGALTITEEGADLSQDVPPVADAEVVEEKAKK